MNHEPARITTHGIGVRLNCFLAIGSQVEHTASDERFTLIGGTEEHAIVIGGRGIDVWAWEEIAPAGFVGDSADTPARADTAGAYDSLGRVVRVLYETSDDPQWTAAAEQARAKIAELAVAVWGAAAAETLAS